MIWIWTVFLLIVSCSGENDYSSYRKIPLCRAQDDFRYPSSTEEVISIVNEAIQRNTTVKMFGIRHSMTDIICTNGIPISNQNLIKFQLNPDNTATFGAGVPLYDLTKFLKQRNRAIRTMPAFGNITLSGAIGTGAHGSTIKYTSTISAQVVALTIVDGFGHLIVITDENELQAFRINLGLLGIIVEVTLQTVPLYKTLAHNYVVEDTALTDGRVQLWARTTDQIAIYWFPDLKQIVVANWTFVSVETKGEARTYDHVPSTYEAKQAFQLTLAESIGRLTDSTCSIFSTLGYKLLSLLTSMSKATLLEDVPFMVPIYTEEGYTVKNPAVGYYDDMIAPTCRDAPTPDTLTCPWSHGNPDVDLSYLDNEVGIALDDLPELVRIVKDIATTTPTYFPIQGILMRFSQNSSMYLSNAYGRDTVHFEWYTLLRRDWNKPPLSLAGYQTIMQTLVSQKFGGRPHWGKNGMIYHSTEVIKNNTDPFARQSFIDIMKKFDPNGIFLNDFGKRLLGTGTKLDVDPSFTRCALLDACICSSGADCGETQICTPIKGYKDFPVCQTIGVEPPTPTPSGLVPTSIQGIIQLMTSISSFIPNLSKIQCLTSLPILPLLGLG